MSSENGKPDIEGQKRRITLKNNDGEVFKIDCAACKLDGGMEAARIAKFSTFIRFIGNIIAIPSVLGMAFALLLFFSGWSVAHDIATQSNAELMGASIGSAIGFGFAIFVFCTSLVGGLIGWLLLMKKNVYRCIRCGYIIDRS